MISSKTFERNDHQNHEKAQLRWHRWWDVEFRNYAQNDNKNERCRESFKEVHCDYKQWKQIQTFNREFTIFRAFVHKQNRYFHFDDDQIYNWNWKCRSINSNVVRFRFRISCINRSIFYFCDINQLFSKCFQYNNHISQQHFFRASRKKYAERK